MKFHSNRVCLRLLVLFSVVSLPSHALPVVEKEDLFQNDISNSTSLSIDPSDATYLQELGINETFLAELTVNLEKAIEKEKQNEQTRLRQDFGNGGGGGVGDYFGLGNGGGQGGQEEDDEDDENATPVAGPGALGVLTGLYGIFSGIGSLNPMRVLASTVNFFPPDRRAAAQQALGGIFGGQNATTALPPLTDAPPAATKVVTTTVKSVTTTDSSDLAKSEDTEDIKIKSTTVKSRVKPKPSTAPPKKRVPIGTEKIEGTSLEEDFAEAVDTVKAPSLETEFGKTADIFKIPEKTTAKPKNATSFIEKEFEETGLKLKFKSNL